MKVRILPVSTIDDTRTILQVVMRLQKYLEENPIRNTFYIDLSYDENTLAYDVTKVKVPTELDVSVAADDLLMFDNGYIALVDNVGDNYVTIVGDSAQEFIGRQGETGVGISNIAKTGTSGLVDTYTITFTNGTTSTFTVTNGAKGDTGNGISSVVKTATSGLVDTYTITFTNGNTTTFTVTNGADGQNGIGISSIVKTGTSGLVDTYTITYSNGSTSTFTVTNGADGTDGAGVPTGGTTGQVLKKKSDTDYDTEWADESGGGSSAQVLGQNLIINPTFTINQRGSTGTVTGDASKYVYTVDRWCLPTASDSITFGITPAARTLNHGSKLRQIIEYLSFYSTGKYLLCGVTYTGIEPTIEIAVRDYNGVFQTLTSIKDKTINITVGESPNTHTSYQKIYLFDISSGDYTGSQIRFDIVNSDNSSGTALENAFAYLCNGEVDIGDTPIPVYYNRTEELEKCKYYYTKVNGITDGNLFFTSASPLNVNGSVIVSGKLVKDTKILEMRISPTITKNTSEFKGRSGDNSGQHTASISVYTAVYVSNNNGCIIRCLYDFSVSGGLLAPSIEFIPKVELDAEYYS